MVQICKCWKRPVIKTGWCLFRDSAPELRQKSAPEFNLSEQRGRFLSGEEKYNQKAVQLKESLIKGDYHGVFNGGNRERPAPVKSGKIDLVASAAEPGRVIGEIY